MNGTNQLFFSKVEQHISDDMNAKLLQPFIVEEFWEAVKGLGSLKAPGTDGYPTLFYKKYWNIIGEDVCNYCLRVIRGEIVVEEIIDTRIILMLKVSNSCSITQFRLISLCNVFYKIIAKALVNRISGFINLCDAREFYPWPLNSQ